VSNVVTMMRMAAMNAAKAVSCTAVSRRWFMFTVFRQHQPEAAVAPSLITSSAVAKSVSGMARPRTFAVFMLSTIRYLVGPCTAGRRASHP
jgi:hypothetical protein